MKVLFIVKELKNSHEYLFTLKKALIEDGIEVKYNVDDFWNHYQNYDIIHIHWPELLAKEKLDEKQYLKIINHFSLVKQFSKIISTCHNLEPHFSNNKYKNFLYKYVYSNCDAIIHLGKYSFEYMKNEYPHIKQYIISHHIYDNLYDYSLDKSVVRKQLKIPVDANVMLCFGSFRDDGERNLVLKAWRKVNIQNKYLLAPGFCYLRRNFILGYKQTIKAIYYKLTGIHFNNRLIPDNLVSTYLCASDIVMIQRVKALNSGNLPLGFHAKKVVVGPDIGNMSDILQKTKNPIFDPNDISSVAKAIQEGFRLKDTDLPQKNYDYAIGNWNISQIARKHLEVYQNLLIDDHQ